MSGELAMPGGWALEKAAPHNGGEVARLIRSSLPARLRRFTIWASPRAGRYVSAMLSGSLPGASEEFYVLKRGRRAAGLAAFRTVDGHAFLNHLYVAPPFRGRGLGACLLGCATRMYLAVHAAAQISLDVFSSNSRAEAWYRRLGFRQCGRRVWRLGPNAGYVRPLPSPDLVPVFAPWGFWTFTICTAAGAAYQVGRLYAPYFRLLQIEAAQDSELLRRLAWLDPKRRLLLIAPAAPFDPAWKQIAVSRRLQCSVGALLDRLDSGSRQTA
jgi:ribosomal protein S18 acetylase RimI-like enzyme